METPIKSAQYQHLSSIERVQIMLFQRQGLSMNAIACELKRAPSTISRELRGECARSGHGNYKTAPFVSSAWHGCCQQASSLS